MGRRADRGRLGHSHEPPRLPALRRQGSDWGTSVSACIGKRSPESVVGLHLVPPLAPPDPATFGDLTRKERASLESLRRAVESESGYSAVHGTKPQTIGYALTDSPAALCAWIAEKFWSWTDHDGDLDAVVSRDELLDNLMLYWLPRAGASSVRLYWESIGLVNEWISGEVSDAVSVPVGCSVFPRELQRPSRRWAERRFADIRYWNEPDRGGHFAPLEQPSLFVEEVRRCFRAIRAIRASTASDGHSRASRIRLSGVWAASRNRPKPAWVNTSRSRASPAWAPRPRPTSWESEFGVQMADDAV
jgi:pimeloyl-ACP methyl ester carboxylesterase